MKRKISFPFCFSPSFFFCIYIHVPSFPPVFFFYPYSCHLFFVGLMMVPDSRTESSPIKFIHKAVITFLSKVVLRLLNQDQKLQFRKLEAISKKFNKLEADIKYLRFTASLVNFCITYKMQCI